MALDVGSRASFKFDGYRAEGYIVGEKQSKYGFTTMWFEPDCGFIIPESWDRSDEFPGAFATATEYLKEIVEDVSDIEPNEIEALLNV